jgi:hypothetical protein
LEGRQDLLDPWRQRRATQLGQQVLMVAPNPGRLVHPPQGIDRLAAKHAHLLIAQLRNLRRVQRPGAIAGPIRQLTQLRMAH